MFLEIMSEARQKKKNTGNPLLVFESILSKQNRARKTRGLKNLI